MRILGVWTSFGAPYVHALLICERFDVRGTANFLIDSGASRISLLDSDAEKLAIDYEKLERFSPGATGIGGIVDAFILPDVKLIFRTVEGFHEEHLAQLFVLKHEASDPESAERIMRLPSLLGRDVLNKYGVVLDRRTHTAVITDEPFGTVG